MVQYGKPHRTVDEQVELLRSRGMEVSDPEWAGRWLSVIGYYRLSGYSYPYRVFNADAGSRGDDFMPGTSLAQVLNLYQFDRRLKLLAWDALERIEIAMRVRVGYTLGMRGTFAHLEPGSLSPSFSVHAKSGEPSRHETWLARFSTEQSRSSEEFVAHFEKHYGGRLPVWVATEIMDFGNLSHLFAGMLGADRNQIAREFGLVDNHGAGHGRALTNVMQAFNYVRNVCAHHSRLWNRNITVEIAPKNLVAIPELAHLKTGDRSLTSRVYGSLCLLAYLMDRLSPGHAWKARLTDLVTLDLPGSSRRTSEMGFPNDWRDQQLWASDP